MDYLAQQVGILFEIIPGNIGDVDVKPGHNASIKGVPNKNAGCYQTIYDTIPIIKSLCAGIEEDISEKNIFLFWSESMETLDHLFTGFCLGVRGFDYIPNPFQQGASGKKEHVPRNIAVIMIRIADMQGLKNALRSEKINTCCGKDYACIIASEFKQFCQVLEKNHERRG
nr:hypothetical protein [Akkermansia muciniphila]